jgi:hypothetical protein
LLVLESALAVVDAHAVHHADPERPVALLGGAMHARPAAEPPASPAIPTVGGVVGRAGVSLVAAAPMRLRLVRRNHPECRFYGRRSAGSRGNCSSCLSCAYLTVVEEDEPEEVVVLPDRAKREFEANDG